MALKTLPQVNDLNWGTPLNAHIGQLQDSTNGGINKFEQFSQRPTTLTADDAGKTYLYTQTGNLHQWIGSEWKVLNESIINVKDYGAIGNGVVDDRDAIYFCINLTKNNPNFDTVYVPDGTYKLNIALPFNDLKSLKFIGESKEKTIFVNTNEGTNTFSSYNSVNLVIENVSFLSKNNNCMAIIGCDNCNLINCEFKLYTSGSTGLYIDSSTNGLVKNCKFYSAGKKEGNAMRLSANCSNWKINNNSFRYLENAIITYSSCIIEDNFFDGGFYTAVADFSGTGSFTPTTLTSSSAGFAGLNTSAFIVRAISEVGTGNFVADGTKIKDTSKNFTTLGLYPGDIVYTTNCFAIVKKIEATVIEVEEWLEKSTRLPTIGNSETNYTVYKTFIGRCINGDFNSTTINVTEWWAMNGQTTTPPNGSSFEVCKNKGNYQILCSEGEFAAVVNNNKIFRPYSDGIGMFASSFLITNNHIYFTQDMGMTISPGSNTTPNKAAQGIVSNNLIEHSGANGIYLGYTSGVVVSSNRISDTCFCWVVYPGDAACGIVIEQAKDCLVSNNLISKSISVKMNKGIVQEPNVTNISSVNNLITSPLI
jgi:parallel beta-helix repeat protein